MEETQQVLKAFQLEKNVQAKLNPDFGLRVSRYIQSTISGMGSYYWIRNERFRRNRNWAAGTIDVQQMFQDRLDMNGKINFVNLAWECIHLINTTVSRLVGRWMMKVEKVSVTAVDNSSQQQKEQEYKTADFVLNNKEMIDGLQQSSGVPVIKQDQFVPEDKDELDIWKSEFNRLPEEIGYELGVNNVLEANGFTDINKDKLLHDSAEVGFVGTYTWMDSDGVIHVDWVKPENAIYSWSEYDDLRDTSWRGQVKSLKISYLREKYGIANGGTLTEEAIFKLASTSKEYQLSDKLTWDYQYVNTFFRPYDEWNIDVIDYELRSVDSDITSMTVSKAGTLTVRRNATEIPVNAETFRKDKYNIYHGVYAINASEMLEWGLKKNMIRPQDPKELGDAEFSYSFYMFQNQKMRNLAVPEKIEEPVKQMILVCLRIQQLIASAAPPGYAINQDVLDAVDLGLAQGTNPASVVKNFQQTGRFYYRGKDAEGNIVQKPIEELRNDGFTSQMTAYENQYTFQFQRVKDELGEDPNLMQAAAQPRVAVDNIQTSMTQADNATGHFYMAYVRVMEETAKKISCLLNDSVTYGAKAYRSLLKEEAVKGRNFSTKIKLLPNEQEIAMLQATMQQAIAATPKLVVYLDPFKILRIAKEDVKLADLYFMRGQKRYIRGEAQLQQQNIQSQADAATQAATQKGQFDQQKTAAESLSAEKQIILTGAFGLLQAGAQITPELQQVLTSVIMNVATPIGIENQQQQKAIQEQQMQEAQQQDGQAPQEEQ